MEISLDLTKSLEENAADYFDKAKKAKKKLEGAKESLNKKIKITEQRIERKQTQKKEWFEKFHWCYSSKKKLIIGGRDAATNELVIKKHAEKEDFAFHTDMSGSPFIVLKNGQNAKKEELSEAATICAINSQAWKKNMPLEVFYVKPEQLSKQAKPGEANPGKGAFIVNGKTTYLTPELKCALGLFDEKVMSGSIASISSHCKKYVILVPGNEKSSSIAKVLLKYFKEGNLDDYIRCIPAGGAKIDKYF